MLVGLCQINVISKLPGQDIFKNVDFQMLPNSRQMWKRSLPNRFFLPNSELDIIKDATCAGWKLYLGRKDCMVPCPSAESFQCFSDQVQFCSYWIAFWL